MTTIRFLSGGDPHFLHGPWAAFCSSLMSGSGKHCAASTAERAGPPELRHHQETGRSLWKTVWLLLKRISIGFTIWPGDSIPGCIPKRTESMKSENGNKPHVHQQMNEWTNKREYLAIRKDRARIHATKWMDLENMMLGKRSQSQSIAYGITLSVWNVQKRQARRNKKQIRESLELEEVGLGKWEANAKMNEVSLGDDGNVLELDSSSCTILWMYSKPLNCICILNRWVVQDMNYISIELFKNSSPWERMDDQHYSSLECVTNCRPSKPTDSWARLAVIVELCLCDVDSARSSEFEDVQT